MMVIKVKFKNITPKKNMQVKIEQIPICFKWSQTIRLDRALQPLYKLGRRGAPRQPNNKTSDSKNCPFLQCLWKPKTETGSSRTFWSGQRAVGFRVVALEVLIQTQICTTSQITVPTWWPETPKYQSTCSKSRGQRRLVVALPLGEIFNLK